MCREGVVCLNSVFEQMLSDWALKAQLLKNTFTLIIPFWCGEIASVFIYPVPCD
jgi:hypothetical protein